MALRKSPERLVAIVESATTVFGEEGFARARMTVIASAAGVSIGTLYNYVEGKEGLFLLVAEHAVGVPITGRVLPVASPNRVSLIKSLERRISERARIGALARALSRAQPSTSLPAEVAEIIGEIYDLIASTRRGADVMERCAREAPDLADLFYRHVRGRLVADLAAYCERARVASGVDPEVAARFIIETVSWFARHRYRDPVPLDVVDDESRRATINLVTRALCAPAPVAGGGNA